MKINWSIIYLIWHLVGNNFGIWWLFYCILIEFLTNFLSDIKIKASYPIAVSEIGIENMILQDTDFTDRFASPFSSEDAVEYSYGSRVEICSCPEGHIGASCETCRDGYYWDRSSSDPSQKDCLIIRK